MASEDLQAKLAALTPEQREQLKRLLREKAERLNAERLKAERLKAEGRAGTPLPAAQDESQTAGSRSIPRIPDADDYALSFAQKRLWLQEQLIEGKTAAYNVSLAVVLRGELDVDALEQAFRAVIARHAILRTVYVRKEGEPRQRILTAPDWHLERWASGLSSGERQRADGLHSRSSFSVPDSPTLAAADREDFVRRANELANQPFALEQELPIRAACMPLDDATHGLALVLHHIACDGSSVPVLLADLRRFYGEKAEGLKPEPTSPSVDRVPGSVDAGSKDSGSVRYIDYAAWHRDWIAGSDAVRARDWWLKQFADLPEPIELPADAARPAVQDFSGCHLHVDLGRTTRDRLAQLGQKSGASVFMTLHAAVVGFLHRYAGCDDVTLGVPTEGRFHPDLGPVVGFFVNTLALRNRVSPHEPFTALLERVRDGVLDAFEHQAYPFDALVDALRLDRDLSRPPLFNVMMGLNAAEDEALRLPRLTAEAVPLALGSSKVDLTFHFVDSADGLSLDLEYATALFSEQRMRRLASYFQQFLEAVLGAPRIAIGDLTLMAPASLRALIESFNPQPADYPRERSLVELFREQVRRAPGADAVYFGGRSFSYSEIDQLSDRIATHIVARLGALRPDEPIALQVERSERMIAGLLGILKAGGCYLPINPGTPSERVMMLLEAGRVRLRLIEEESPVPGWKGSDADLRAWCAGAEKAEGPMAEKAEGLEAERLKRTPTSHGKGGSASLVAASASEPTASTVSSNLAYIIFTSGSTGQPKGVLIEQRSVVRLVRNTDFLQLGPGDRVLQTGSLAFDASTFEIWAPLLNGGCCCLPRGKEILEIAEFGALLEATGATTCFLTTGLFNQIADFNPQAFSRLRNLLTGGEKVSVPHINRVLAVAPGIRLLHVYGPTENTTFSTWHPVRQAAAHDVPIGRAIAHSTVYILDRRGNLLPPGVVGELFCGGEGIARGYLGGPELTADRFVPDPFSNVPGSRLYRTGDLGRWDDDGNVEFVGRNDDQVKIRGFRIELGEIELRLRAISGVQQAVVVARPSGGTHELVAYVVQPGGSAESVRAALGRNLPEYMVPTHVVFLDALPLNTSGKVNRRALPAPECVREELPVSREAVEWTTPAEKALAAVWADVLGRPPQDREAHYFNIGGDSIKAIQMAARLRPHGFKLTLRDVFARPRFGELVAALVPVEDAAVETVPAEGEVPLTPIQRWFLETFTPPFDHFNQATLLECSERLEPAKARETLEILLRRHAMLRCRVFQSSAVLQPAQGAASAQAEATRTIQTIPPASEPPAYTWREADEAAFAMVADELHRSLSLADGRLVAAGLFHGASSDRLLLVIHHWAVDGLSWRILVEEFEAIYGALVSGKPAPALRSSAPFRAWAQALQIFASSEAAQRQLAYWRRAQPSQPAAGAQALDEAAAIVLPVELTAKLLGPANAPYGTQVNELLLAVLGRAWNDAAHDGSLLLAMEGHGRESCVGNVDVSQTVGWFTSLWPFLLATTGDWPERIREAKDALRAVPDHGIGFGALRYLANPDGLDRAAPRVSFNYLGEFGGGDVGLFKAVPGVVSGQPAAAHLCSPFDLDIVAEVTGGQLRVAFHFHRALLSPEARRALSAGFEQALRDCVSHSLSAAPRLSLADITGGVDSLAELDRLVADFGPSTALHPASTAPIEPAIEDVLPLTPLQEGMIFHALREPASAAYFDQVVLRLRGALDPVLFEKAWLALGKQHPNLRAVFRADLTARPVGVVVRGSRLGFKVVDAPPQSDAASLERLYTAERSAGLDVTTGPLLRITLVRLSADEHDAILGFHHSILDGWSSGLIWRALEANYQALAGGKPLPRAERTFRDFLRWLGSRDRREDLAYWRTTLSGCPSGVIVPTGAPRLGAPPIRTRSTTWELGADRSERLAELARRLGTTGSALFQTLWGVFLGKLNGRTDVVFGATVSGRSERVPHVESIVGMLINTIPVRIAWDGSTTFRALAEQVRKDSAAGLERLGVSLADIEGAVLESGSLIQHTLVFENYPEDDPREAARRLWQTETIAVHDPMHFEFGALIVPSRGNWLCRVVADEARYPDSHFAALRRTWEETIDRCLGAPDGLVDAWRPGTAMQQARRVVVAATFTAEPLAEPLGFWFDALGCAQDVRFAPFNQVLQQLLDPLSEVRTNRSGANVLLVRLEDWLGADRSNAAAAKASLALASRQFSDALRAAIEGGGSVHWCVRFCPASPAVRADPRLAAELAAAENELSADIQGFPRLQLSRNDPGAAPRDADLIGGVPYTEDYFADVATDVVRSWEARTRSPLKVLALDADNTLWRGVLGEDGVDGVVLTDAHRRVQEMAKSALEKGVLLALVSKNNPDDLRQAFERRMDFPLRWKDFVIVEAGWSAKSGSLRRIAETLNLGRESFVFLDDSAVECAEVRSALPEVLTLQLPESEEAIVRFVEGCWALDFVGGTAEDRQRTELYRVEAQREQARQTATGGLKEFVRQLGVEVALVPIDADNLARAAQLTQRTNQFNASTVRRTEAEVTAFLAEPCARGVLVDVKDRFGAYGLSGCVLYRESAGEWTIDTLLLSCRVLGRGVEHEVLRRLAALAKEAGATSLRVRFAKTPKNAPAEQFLRSSATRAEEGAFVFDVAAAASIEVDEVGRGFGSAPGADKNSDGRERSPGPTTDEKPTGREVGRGLRFALGSEGAPPAPWAFHQTVATELASSEALAEAIAAWRRRQRSRAHVAAYEAPHDERERTIATVWADVLGVERVGRSDDFFALGGHSLRAVMMLSRVNRALGIELDLEAIFAAPVLADFAERAAMAGRSESVSLPVEPAEPATDYPLSHAQRRLWMIEQMRGPGPSPFHMVATFRGTGTPPVERLTLAFRRLIARHESLRTGIVTVNGEPRQVVAAEVSFSVERLRDNGGADVVTEFLERGFDLSQPPLLRVGLREESGGAWTLAIVMHHIVSDGWSIGIMARELSAFFRDPTAPMEPLRIHYKDYAAWQAGQLASGRWERLGSYWRQLFVDAPAPLQLAADRLRPAVKQSRGGDVSAVCGAGVWNAVRQQAARDGASPFMALMAVLQILLARHARSRRFVVGTPVAGRDQPELEPQVGFYVNLLPILAEMPTGVAFSEHLARVKTSVASALSAAAYPFDRLVDDLHLERDMSRAPLFDVLLVYQGRQVPDLALDGVTLAGDDRRSTTAQYDLTFEFAETDEGLHLRLEYDRALFDEVRVERLAAQFFTLLRNAFESPATPIERLELCPAPELERIRGFERGERFGSYRAATIPQLVAEAAARAGTRPAIRTQNRDISYPELDALSLRYADAVARAGVARQAVVAVAGARSEHFIAAMLGVMCAGCVFLPIDLKHPDERLRSVLSDGGVAHAIAIGAAAETRLRGLGLTLVGTKAEALKAEGLNRIVEGSELSVESRKGPEVSDLAYVIYTSGSTGKPKGVEITHGAFATMIESQIAAFGVEPTDRCAWWASCAFDASLSEIFLALACGATVVIAEEAERDDADRYRTWLREQHVTVATLPPAFLRVFKGAPLDPLRVLITAGEAADPRDAAHYAQSLDYFNAYGPTETSVCATVQRVLPTAQADASTPVPIGRPLPVASVYVLDDAGRRQPLGVPGELFIGGRIVGRGYRHAPELTAARFVADPFAGDPDARMYRTGDMARWGGDGALEFLGREDGQVKVRGYRIELGEIESALRASESVRDAAVVARVRPQGTVLVAYVVGEQAAERQVREQVAGRLPDYMRPAAYVWLEKLPMNASGKLDKAALPQPVFEDAGAVVSPTGEREETLAAAWRECLGVERVGRESDFFALGGDSIKALSLSSAVRARGWRLGLKEIYAQPKLAAQAEQMSAVAPTVTREVEGDVPLLPIQRWFMEAHGDSPLHHFNQGVFYRTSGPVDAARLETAVVAVWRRHPSLRAVFEQENGTWRQRIRPASAASPVVAILDVTADTPEMARDREREWVRQLQTGFDLSRGPLVRYGLIRSAAGDKVVGITHHLVSDWVSHRVLLEDLNAAYRGEAPAVGGSEVGDWIESARAWAKDAQVRTGAVRYWRNLVSPSSAGDSSASIDRSVPPAGRYGEVATASHAFTAEETSRLRAAVAGVRGATVRDALLAGMARAGSPLALGAAGKGKAFAVQLEGHGREGFGGAVDVSRTVGWFTSLFPFVVVPRTGEPWTAAVARMRDAVAAVPDNGASYGVLRTYASGVEIPAVPSVVGFNYLGEFASAPDGAFFQLADELPSDAIAARFERDNPVDLSAWIFAGRLHLQLAYLESQVSAAKIDAWLKRVAEALGEHLA